MDLDMPTSVLHPNSWGMCLHKAFSLPIPKNAFTNIKISRILLKISQGALNKDPTVWLDGSRHANISISPSFLGNEPTQQCGIPIPKNTFASIKN
jgi:hypothetical protein